MKNKMMFSVDVEPDLHTGKYIGITQGLRKFEVLCDKYKVKPVLFVTTDCIKKCPGIFKKLHKKGWEISSHGFSHKRFDDMSYHEKEDEIKKSIEYFKKYLGIKPKGFRAPQHSIDNATLDLLEKYNFEYDSSYTPFNLLQLVFFPKRIGSWFKGFFSRTNPYKIRENLVEIPVSSILLPAVSLVVRVFPKWFLRDYFYVLQRVYRKPMFYAHSWDFIEMKQSRIDRYFNHILFLSKLEGVMKYA